MTDNGSTATAVEALPEQVTVTAAFTRRLPSQRLIDTLGRIDPAPFAELAASQPFRIICFRALLRDYPARDQTSLWLHSYDCEVDIEEETGPTQGVSMPLSPVSAPTGTVSP